MPHAKTPWPLRPCADRVGREVARRHRSRFARGVRDFDADEAAERLLDTLGRQPRAILSDVASGGRRGSAQLALVNELLKQVRTDYPSLKESVDPVADPPRVLQAIRGLADRAPNVPETGLGAPWLFTAGKGSPSLLTELLKEAASCDQIDILVSFITVSGVRKLIDVLRSTTAANAAGVGRTKIRVPTTTHMGATEVAALQCAARSTLSRAQLRGLML